MLKYEIWKQAMFIMIQDGCGIEPPLARSRQGEAVHILADKQGEGKLYLRLWVNGGERLLEGEDAGGSIAFQFVAEDTGLIWYYFILEQDGRRRYYGVEQGNGRDGPFL